MDSTSIPYLFSADHLDSLAEPNISSKPFDLPDELPVHYQQICLLAPCTINISTSWLMRNTIWRILLIYWACFIILCRIHPIYRRFRRTELLFYTIGIGTNPRPLNNRRELLVLILYGLAFTSILNLLEAQQMAFGTVLYRRACYKTVPEIYHSDLRVKLHPLVQQFLVTEVDPALQERIVLDYYTRVDLSTQRFAYMVACDSGRKLAQTAANYNPEIGLFRMAIIEEPVATSGIPVFLKKYTAETGIQMQELDVTLTNLYDQRISPDLNDSRADRGMLFKIFKLLSLFYSLAIVVFGLEMVPKDVPRKIILKMICSMKSLKQACLERVGKRMNVKRVHVQIVKTVQK